MANKFAIKINTNSQHKKYHTFVFGTQSNSYSLGLNIEHGEGGLCKIENSVFDAKKFYEFIKLINDNKNVECAIVQNDSLYISLKYVNTIFTIYTALVKSTYASVYSIQCTTPEDKQQMIAMLHSFITFISTVQ
jgi:hypothetical protein